MIYTLQEATAKSTTRRCRGDRGQQQREQQDESTSEDQSQREREREMGTKAVTGIGPDLVALCCRRDSRLHSGTDCVESRRRKSEQLDMLDDKLDY